MVDCQKLTRQTAILPIQSIRQRKVWESKKRSLFLPRHPTQPELLQVCGSCSFDRSVGLEALTLVLEELFHQKGDHSKNKEPVVFHQKEDGQPHGFENEAHDRADKARQKGCCFLPTSCSPFPMPLSTPFFVDLCLLFPSV